MTSPVSACEVCGLPTIVEFGPTFCALCLKLLCVDCQESHPRTHTLAEEWNLACYETYKREHDF